jgi:hypothetical protein
MMPSGIEPTGTEEGGAAEFEGGGEPSLQKEGDNA